MAQNTFSDVVKLTFIRPQTAFSPGPLSNIFDSIAGNAERPKGTTHDAKS